MEAEWIEFKNCCRIQYGLDLEAWDVMLFQPLKDFYAWWMRQLDTTRAYINWLLPFSSQAATAILGKIARIASAEVSTAFAVLLVAVVAGLGLGTMMDIVGRCFPAFV